MRNIDFYSDPARSQLARLLNATAGAQALMKVAQVEDHVDDLPASAFADPANRKFPVHSPEQAVLSHLYAKYANETVEKNVLTAIDEALEAYGVPASALQPVRVKVAALTENECVFPDQQAFPIRTADEVKASEAHLLKQAHKLLPLTKAAAFTKLAKAADVHGVKLENQSMAYAGRAGTDAKVVLAALQQRYYNENRPESAEAEEQLSKIAAVHDAIADSPSQLRNPQIQAKIAAVLIQTDRKLGYEKQYGRALIDPIDAVYSAKKVASADEVCVGTKYCVPRTTLGSLPRTFYSDALGPEFAEDVHSSGALDSSKVAEVLSTLPADMAENFARALKSAGIAVREA